MCNIEQLYQRYKSLTFINDSKAIILKSLIIFALIINVIVTLKQHIAVFFSIAFLAVIILPTILFVVDDSFDTSIVISISEEEQEKDGEKVIDVEFLLFEATHEVIAAMKQSPKNNLIYCSRAYTTPHFYIISPPPDTI